MADRCIFEPGKLPGWVARKLMHFKKLDGSIGYELETARGAVTVAPGDEVRRNESGKIFVKKRQKQRYKQTQTEDFPSEKESSDQEQGGNGIEHGSA